MFILSNEQSLTSAVAKTDLLRKLAAFFGQRPLLPSIPVWENNPVPTYRTAVTRPPKPPLLPEGTVPVETPLDVLIDRAEKLEAEFSFGTDIDDVHQKLFNPGRGREEKHHLLREWLSRYQPCLFGRLASKGLKGFNFDICWLEESDIAAGEALMSAKIQRARKQWKDRAALGFSHGFLIILHSKRLTWCKPSESLIRICQRFSDLYLIEAAPVELDTIYTEAMPLRAAGRWKLFKAGVNIFYSGAHRTLNHDRRVPGGILISVNSPGHLANSLVMRGLATDFESAVKTMFDLALRSIGNGGIGHQRGFSTSWHSASKPGGRCPFHVVGKPTSDVRRYSAAYHTDVLIPASVTSDPDLDSTENLEVWPHLILDYISSDKFQTSHVNYGLFHGHPIPEEAKYFNPWTPRRAVNEKLLELNDASQA